MKKEKLPTYEEWDRVPANLIVEAMNRGEETFWVRGLLIGISSTRILTYTKGLQCVIKDCPCIGNFFIAERMRNMNHPSGGTRGYHFNLYYVMEDGTKEMMTSDHIVAKATGGGNELGNRQPMCQRHNSLKGCRNDYDGEETPIIRDDYDPAQYMNTIFNLQQYAEGLSPEKNRNTLNHIRRSLRRKIRKMVERYPNDRKLDPWYQHLELEVE